MGPSHRLSHSLRWSLAFVAAASTSPGTARAQVAASTASEAPSLADSLRLDPAVHRGVLPNGLRSFIQRNLRPKARASLQLAVKAGSNLEADDQRGLAHLAEHMNFNGSLHFKPDELVAYLQSIGLRFGADANAYTSFDETVYMLQVPTDRDSLLDRGLTALSDFAGRALLSQAEIDKERGVVLEEWRLGRRAQQRLQRKQLPVLLRGSRYAERLPIGKPEIIEHAPASRLRDFYRTWYTPDRMAVIAVGDFDPTRMDSLIRVHFADLRKPAAPRPTPQYGVPPHRETLISIATDKELPYNSASIAHMRPRRTQTTVRDYRRSLVESLFSSMLNARLDEIGHRGDAPFLWARGFSVAFVRPVTTYLLVAGVTDGGIDKGFTALLQEIARVRQHGFLASELARAKEGLQAENERAYAERDKTESDDFASELAAYFTAGDVPPGIEASHALTKALLPGIGVDEVNALVGQMIREQDRVVLVSVPQKAGAAAPTEGALRAVLARVGAQPTAAWQDSTAGKSLMSELPKPGRVQSRRTVEEIGATVLTLSNGAEVWLKPTDFKADEVMFTCYARGGLSVADSAAFTSAWLAAQVVNDAGVGGFKSADLQKLLSGHLVEVSPYMDDYLHGVSGS